jgi:hypothetical protein
MKKMRGVTLTAEWSPKPEFKLGAKDIDKVSTYLGSLVWKNPRIEIRDYDIPEPGPGQVLIKIKACGICGSDVHMAQAKDDGYKRAYKFAIVKHMYLRWRGVHDPRIVCNKIRRSDKVAEQSDKIKKS